MIGFYGHKVLTATISTAGTTSDAIRTEGYTNVLLEIPTFSAYCVSATANVYVQGAYSSAVTFSRIKDMGAYSSGVGVYDWEVPATTGNYLAMCKPAAMVNFIKVEVSITATAAMACVVHLHN